MRVLAVIDEVADALHFFYIVWADFDPVELFGDFQDGVVTGDRNISDGLAVLDMLLIFR